MALSTKNTFSCADISAPTPPPQWTTRSLHRTEEVVPAIENLIREVEAVGFPEREVFAIRLALEEALVNAIKHGHKGDPSKEVQLRYHVLPNRLLVEIEDQGPGFNPNAVPNPLAVENLDRSCGRGLLLMRHYMTWVHFNETGNRVTMCRQR